MTKKELIHRIEICRDGLCHECPYSSRDKSCTDTLIDDIYFFLINNQEEDVICPYCGSPHYHNLQDSHICSYCGKEF